MSPPISDILSLLSPGAVPCACPAHCPLATFLLWVSPVHCSDYASQHLQSVEQSSVWSIIGMGYRLVRNDTSVNCNSINYFYPDILSS